jgi:hypothetical protein
MMQALRPGTVEWKRLLAILIALSPIPVCMFGYLRYPRFMAGQNDFLGTYIGIRLMPAGKMYSSEAHYAMQRQFVSLEIPEILYTRPPYHAVLLAPLGWLPYPAAFWAFEGLSALALVGFLYMYRNRMEHLAWWCAVSLPLLILMLNGQDDIFLLFFFAAALELMRRGRETAAGAVLALCAYKFHLFLLLPVALAICRRWRVLGGGIAGGAVLAAVSFAAGGSCWPLEVAAIVSNPQIRVSRAMMGNLEALALSFPSAEPWLLFAAYAVVAGSFLWIARREKDTEAVLGWALAGGLLVSIHTWPHDLVLLLAAVPLIGRNWKALPRRAAEALLLLPVLPLALLDERTAFLFPATLGLLMAAAAVRLGAGSAAAAAQ